MGFFAFSTTFHGAKHSTETEQTNKKKKWPKVTSLNMRLVCAANQQRGREKGQCGSAGILNVGVGEEVHLE